MPNIANVLKAEITRVAKKEVRTDTESLRKAVAFYRHEIAALKKRLAQVEKDVKRSGRRRGPEVAPVETQTEVGGRQLRFSATRFAAQRKKLGLSAADFAKLLGVSSLSVYKWESGKTRPRRAQLQAIAAARNLGKREALARLEQLDQAA
jgi:DNA-binding transcriptional regulator YiaG